MNIYILIFLCLNFVHAKNHDDEYKFRPDYWSKGLHLNVGGGLNSTYYDADERFKTVAFGLNFKTDLGYYFTNRFAIEWSSNVKFNRISEYLVWDTLITFGLRYRMKEYYVRPFLGKAPTVVFFNGHPPAEYKGTKASRLQFDGPVYGFAVGKMFERKDGLLWFIETSATLQSLQEREAIHMDGDVPKVISRETDQSTLVSVYFMIGVLIF